MMGYARMYATWTRLPQTWSAVLSPLIWYSTHRTHPIVAPIRRMFTRLGVHNPQNLLEWLRRPSTIRQIHTHRVDNVGRYPTLLSESQIANDIRGVSELGYLKDYIQTFCGGEHQHR